MSLPLSFLFTFLSLFLFSLFSRTGNLFQLQVFFFFLLNYLLRARIRRECSVFISLDCCTALNASAIDLGSSVTNGILLRTIDGYAHTEIISFKAIIAVEVP